MTGRLETMKSWPGDAAGDRPDGERPDGDRRDDRRRGRRRRAWRTAAMIGVVLVAAGATVVATLGLDGRHGGTATAASLPPATAQVARTSLRQTTDVDGTLGYGDSRALSGRVAGVLTGLPAEGAIVRRGQALYTMDTKPAMVLLYGNVPAYRTLAAGETGADVRELEQNLRALGYTGFTVDDEYTEATATAVKAWQEDLGITETGRVDLGQVLFASGPLRVAEQKMHVGDQVGPGAPVYTYTGTNRVVSVDLPVEDQHLVRRGGTVTVELPDGSTVAGRVASVGTVAHPPSSREEGASATVDVTVTLADQRSLGSLDQAPVTVHVVSAERRNALAVPVAALLALREGGYGVQVVTGGTSHIVAVRTGMFADGQVEISGSGIAEGTVVGVPAS